VLILLIAALVIAAAGGGGGGGMLSKRSSKKTRKQHNKRRSLSRSSRPRTKSNSHSNRAAEGKSRHCKNLALATAHIR
jgi:hypothetical protein